MSRPPGPCCGSRLAVLAGTVFVCLMLAAGCRESAPDSGSPPPPAAPAPAETHFCRDPAAATETSALLPGTPAEGELAGGEVHGYRIELAQDEYLEVVVEQQGIDLVAALLGPGGEPLTAVDGLGGATGSERLPWWSSQAGGHLLLLCADDPPGDNDGGRGGYRVRIEQLRSAVAADRKPVAAARAFAQAEELGDAPARLDKYREALALWRELGDRPRQLDALYRLGRLRTDAGEWRPALELYQAAVTLFDAVDAPRIKAAILAAIGRCHFHLGEMEAARQSYAQADDRWRRLGDLPWQTLLANELGRTHALLGEMEEALASYDRALAGWRQLGRRGEEATTLHNRGRSYHLLGDKERARDDLRQALALRREVGDVRGQAATLTALGLVAQKWGESQVALGHFREALDLRREVADRRGEAVTLTAMALTYEQLGEGGEALDRHLRALPIFRRMGDRRQEAVTLHNVGWLLSLEGRPAEALERYAAALALFEDLADPNDRIATLLAMAHAERQRGDLERARELAERALGWVERQRLEPSGSHLRSSYFATQQDHFDFYVDLLMELDRRQPGAGYDRRALATSERARARSHLDLLAVGGADLAPGTDPALGERRVELEDAIRAKEHQRRRMVEAEMPAQLLAPVEARLRELLGELDRLQGRLREAGEEPELLAVEDIQRRLLDRETLLLEYRLGRERSFLWAVSSDGFHSFELPARDAIEAAARQAYGLLRRSHLRKWHHQTELTLRRVSEMLLAPAAELLKRKRLLIVADGALHYLPFAALPAPGHAGEPLAGEPLADEHEIVTAPSASMLAELRRQLAGRRPAAGALAVIADPVFDLDDPRLAGDRDAPASRPLRGAEKRLGRLVYSRQEADAILALAPAEARFAAFGFDANRATVVSGRLAGYRIVHFATHGELDSERPELSRLVLSAVDADGRERPSSLFAHEIYGLELPAELVVASACRTALGREIRGEGLVGLTRALFHAGAARVVVSLWNVDDRATAELMERFYRHLLEHRMRPTAALRRAQESIRREPQWRAPYYWAGFVIQGEWK